MTERSVVLFLSEKNISPLRLRVPVNVRVTSVSRYFKRRWKFLPYNVHVTSVSKYFKRRWKFHTTQDLSGLERGGGKDEFTKTLFLPSYKTTVTAVTWLIECTYGQIEAETQFFDRSSAQKRALKECEVKPRFQAKHDFLKVNTKCTAKLTTSET